jgi:hypothetical protein
MTPDRSDLIRRNANRFASHGSSADAIAKWKA